MGDIETFVTLVVILFKVAGFLIIPFLGTFILIWLIVKIARETKELKKMSEIESRKGSRNKKE